MSPGDLIIVIVQKQPDQSSAKPSDMSIKKGYQEKKEDEDLRARYARIGPDLLVEKSISLRDALCGTAVSFKHLDGRELRLTSKPGQVLAPGTCKRIRGEGMPIHGDPFSKGNMYVVIKVLFPEKLHESKIPTLKDALTDVTPLSPEADDNKTDFTTTHNNNIPREEDEIYQETWAAHQLESVDDVDKEIHEDILRMKGARPPDTNDPGTDDDMDGFPHGQRVQCAQS
jgi:DnaJ family protein A protein 2